MEQAINNKNVSTITRASLAVLVVVVCFAIIPAQTARAQSGGDYDLSWNTIDGTGGRVGGGCG